MNLLINEFAKDYKKKTTWLYIILFLAIIFVKTYFMYKAMGDNVELGDTILVSLEQDAVGIGSLFVLIMFANNLSQEYSKGTIKFLYSKPKSRSAILTSKIVLSLINFIIFTVIGTIFNYVIQKVFIYKDKLVLPSLSKNLGSNHFDRTVLEQFLLFNLLAFGVMLFYISLVLLVCVVCKTQILSIVMVMVMLLGGSIIMGLTALAVEKWEWVKYHMFDVPLIDTYFSTKIGREAVEVFKFTGTQLTIMLVGYTLLFLIISYIVNARRDITLD